MPKQVAVAPKCCIDNIDKFGKRCANVLRSALASADYVQHTKVERTPITTLMFFSPPKIDAEIRGENRPVLRMHSDLRWLHVSIDLKCITKNRWQLEQISVGLLHGEASNSNKRPLLRAEWQNNTAGDASGHGQPHWHVLGAAGLEDVAPLRFAETVEQQSSSDFAKFLDDSTSDVHDSSDFAHFHYAMATGWHTRPSRSPGCSVEDEDSLVSWLDGCVRYIEHQLVHVARKSRTTMPA